MMDTSPRTATSCPYSALHGQSLAQCLHSSTPRYKPYWVHLCAIAICLLPVFINCTSLAPRLPHPQTLLHSVKASHIYVMCPDKAAPHLPEHLFPFLPITKKNLFFPQCMLALSQYTVESDRLPCSHTHFYRLFHTSTHTPLHSYI